MADIASLLLSNPKLLTSTVVLHRLGPKEIEEATRRRVSQVFRENSSESIQTEPSFMGFESDSDDGGLQIDETSQDVPISMPNLDLLEDVPKTTRKGVEIEYAHERNPFYGSATYVPKEAKRRKYVPKKVYAETGTQYQKDDLWMLCKDCMDGKTKTKLVELVMGLHEVGIDIPEMKAVLDGSGTIFQLRDALKLLDKKMESTPKVVTHSSVHVKRRLVKSRRPIPALMPIEHESAENPNNETLNLSKALNYDNTNQFLPNYTEEEISMSTFEFSNQNSFQQADPFDLNQYHQRINQQFFSGTSNLNSTTFQECQITTTPCIKPNFYVSIMNPDTSSTANETADDTPKENNKDNTENGILLDQHTKDNLVSSLVGEKEIHQNSSNDDKHTDIIDNEESHDLGNMVSQDPEIEFNYKENKEEIDVFAIDNSDREAIENSLNTGEIERFPEKTPTDQIFSRFEASTPQPTVHEDDDNEDDQDALQINTDVEFEGDFGDLTDTPELKQKPDTDKKSLERKSILAYEEEIKTDTSTNRNRFSKKNNQDQRNSDYKERINKRELPDSTTNNPRKRFKFEKKNLNIDPWSPKPDLNSPFKANLFPQQQFYNNPANQSAGQKLFNEFNRICRQRLYQSVCTGGINCNGNHTFPDENLIRSLMVQMNQSEIVKFIGSCYKSVECSIRYFPLLAEYFGRNNMKHHLVDAIQMAESNVLLLVNYKWIVQGLILSGVTTPIAIQTLLDNQKKFMPQANKIIVEIITKTNMESQFLDKLIQISEFQGNVFSAQIVNKLMDTAMNHATEFEKWEILIDNIWEHLSPENQAMLDNQLMENFVQWLQYHKENLI
uniref:CSON012048 protein n=1 Tax=Culicoides sonorensis TaxID=179676 RepID=A0A336M4J0_CULSO